MKALRMQSAGRFKSGFTIIEVMLFLAITGALLMGLFASTSSTISKQRYSASVQDFSMFLREVYNQAENVQIALRRTDGVDLKASGRSDVAVYGKLLTIGEGSSSNKELYVYDVVGDVIDAKNNLLDGVSTEKGALSKVGITLTVNENGATRFVSSYSRTLSWDAWIEQTKHFNNERLRAAILIVRSPLNGMISTYYETFAKDVDFNIHEDVDSASNFLNSFKYKQQDLHLCVNSEDRGRLGRRMLTIKSQARNASDLVLIDSDTTDASGKKLNHCEEDYDTYSY